MNPTVGTRLDRRLIERIDVLAKIMGQSRSAWVKEALEASVTDQERRISNLALGHDHQPGKPTGPVNSDVVGSDVLSPTQRAVWELLMARPDGMCRRDFSAHDVWEVSNRISEIEAKLRVEIARERCWKHLHRHRVVLYRL